MAGVWLPVALVLLQGGLASPVRLQEVTLDHLVRDAAPDVFNRMGRLDPAYTNPCFQSHIDGSLKCMAYFNILGPDDFPTLLEGKPCAAAEGSVAYRRGKVGHVGPIRKIGSTSPGKSPAAPQGRLKDGLRYGAYCPAQVVDAKQKEPFYWSERRESFDKQAHFA